MRRVTFTLSLVVLVITTDTIAPRCGEKSGPTCHQTPVAFSSNPLTVAEKSSGWKLLFDGRTIRGWRGFRRQDFPVECWKVEEGVLKRLPIRRRCGDVITEAQYENFQLHLEWQVGRGGNTGVKYLVSEDRPATWEQAYMEHNIQELKQVVPVDYKLIAGLTPERWRYSAMGFELQLIDDQGNPDAGKATNRTTGALYDLIAPSQKSLCPVGKFNRACVHVQGNHVEHWVNGIKVVEFERGSKKLEALIADSKFKHLAGFATLSRGHIALQDHEDEVWFRNIKIRELPSR